MKTVAITSNTSWYLYNFRRNTIKALLGEGYRVLTLAPRDAYSSKLEKLGAEFLHIPIDQGGTNPLSDLKTLWCFYRSYRKLSPDVVLNFTPKNNIYSTLAASIQDIPCINNIAGLGLIFINENFTANLARLLYRISQPRAKRIFFQNDEDKELFLKGRFAKEELTHRLPGSGVDLQRFAASPAPNDGTVRFLLVARMLREKGICEFVEAARILTRRYDNLEFNLLGHLDVNNPSAISSKEMRQWHDEGIINYLGVSDQVEQIIATADCIVLPSYYREGVPKSLLEGAAMAKPLITTRNIGCKDTVDDGINGYLCEIRNTDDLVNKLEKIIAMPYQQRLDMGNKSREKMERDFDEKIVIKKYLGAISSVLDQTTNQ